MIFFFCLSVRCFATATTFLYAAGQDAEVDPTALDIVIRAALTHRHKLHRDPVLDAVFTLDPAAFPAAMALYKPVLVTHIKQRQTMPHPFVVVHLVI